MLLLCHYFRANPNDFSKLVELSQTGFYEFRTYPLLESFINNIIDNRCLGATPIYARQLLDALLQNKAAQNDAGPKRQIYHLHGVVYLKEHQADLALRSFAKTQRILPDVEAGLLQASLLANHGMFAEALELLKVIQNNFGNNKKALSQQKKINFANEIMRLEKLLLEDLDKENKPKI